MTLAEVVAAATKDFAENGYDSDERLAKWIAAIRIAAEQTFTSQQRMQEMMRDALRAVFDRLVQNESILRRHPGVDRYTLARIAPHLRNELDRRIVASASLIKLNRDEMIARTLRRFSGWATSIPLGGSDVSGRMKAAEEIKKSARSLPFLQRRVLIDQSHKLNSSLNSIVAEDGGAIGAKWFSHWRQVNYNYREDHKERDGKVYLIRDSWAHKKGFVKPMNGYTDDITQPGEEVYCRCRYTYVYALRNLPDEMVTKAGKEALEEARAKFR